MLLKYGGGGGGGCGAPYAATNRDVAMLLLILLLLSVTTLRTSGPRLYPYINISPRHLLAAPLTTLG
jgi:hypothetical protein